MLGHGVSYLTVAGADAVAASLVGFGGACGKGQCVTVAFVVAGLNLFFDVILFLFSVASPFLTLGFVLGSGSLNWLAGAGIIGPILFSTSRKVLIFLIMFRCRQSFVVHSMHLISCVIQSLLKMCVPYIDMTLTSTSTTSTGSLHLKYLCRNLHSGWSRHAIWNIKNVPEFMLFLDCTMLFLALPLYENFAFAYSSFFWLLFCSAFWSWLILVILFHCY